MRKAIVRVIYKSGYAQDVKCTRFIVRHRAGVLTEIEWENAVPKPMYLGVDEISAVYLIRASR